MTEADTKQEAERDGVARFWLGEIERAGKREEKWRKQGREVLKRYRSERPSTLDRRARGFNILWSNVETLKPSVYGQMPPPHVTRRFFDEDPVGKQASEILERGLSFVMDDPEFSFHESLKSVRDDMLLPGRGGLRVRLEAPLEKLRPQALETESGTVFLLNGFAVEPEGEDGEGAFIERVTRRTLMMEHFYWEDYREGDARCWEELPWIGFRHLMTRKALKEAFGSIGAIVPLNHKPDGERDEDDPEHHLRRAVVWEIWDKENRERIWVAEGFNEQVLDKEDDPLGLQGFFPMSGPLYAIKTTDTRVPVPEFEVYKDQADELDRITLRIGKLIEAIKVRGVYAAVLKEIQNLLDGEDNEVFPVEDWAALMYRGGVEGACVWLPIEQMAKVLVALYEQRDKLKQEIFELTGISDLQRGATDPRETASAQNLKGSFGNVRLQPRREPMEFYIRGTLRIMAEVMSEHFEARDLQMMTGKQVTPEVMQLLRDDKMRGFRVDIETESTVRPDEEREQQNAVGFLSATVEYFQGAAEVAAVGGPAALAMMMEAYKAGARRFKMGRELEEVIESSVDQLIQQASQPQRDPEAEKAQADLEMKQRKAEVDAQAKQAMAALEAQLKQQEAQQEMIIRDIEAESNIRIRRAEAVAQAEIDQFKAVNDAEIAQVRAERESNAVN